MSNVNKTLPIYPKRRNRISVVCTNCKKKKTKCDRNLPCGTCQSTGKDDTCTYIHKVSLKQDTETALAEYGFNNVSSKKGEEDSNSLMNDDVNDITDNVNGTDMDMLSDLTNISTETSTTMGWYANEQRSYLNLAPFGKTSVFKRSSFHQHSIYSNLSMIRQDRYADIFTTFRSIIVRKTVKAYKKDNQKSDSIEFQVENGSNNLENTVTAVNYDKNLHNLKVNEISVTSKDLPKSFSKMDVFEGMTSSNKTSYTNHQLIYKNLIDKYGTSRKWDNDDILNGFSNLNEFMENNMPNKVNFIEIILPFFEKYILKLIPVLDCQILKDEVILLYERVGSKSASIKQFDHIFYCIVLLISRICQISIKYSIGQSNNNSSDIGESQRRNYIDNTILEMRMEKYISIVTALIFRNKLLRKSTLFELINLLLLRFYYWISPELGEGQELEQSQILHSLIVSHCKEIGVSWDIILYDPDYMKVHNDCRPRLTNRNIYNLLYKKIWAYVLYLDRKALLLTGVEFTIGNSYSLNDNILASIGLNKFEENGDNCWYLRMMAVDTLLFKLNNYLHENYTKVNYKKIEELINNIKILIENIEVRYNINNCEELDFELNLLIKQFRMNFTYSQLIWFELNNDIILKNDTMNKLFILAIEMINICYNYFHGQKTNLKFKYTKFYLNKCIEIILNKVISVILQCLIIRLPEKIEDNIENGNKCICDRYTLIKIFFGVCTLYFNEFAYDYYRSFRSMFNAKISYKMFGTNKSNGEKESFTKNFELIIAYLNYKAEKHNTTAVYYNDTMLLTEKLPYINDKKIMTELLLTITENKLVYEGDIEYYRNTVKDMTECSSFYPFNIFLTIYNDAKLNYSCGPISNTKIINGEKDTNGPLNVEIENLGIDNMDITINNITSYSSSNVDQDQEMNVFINELFEPIDILTFF
ncbi:hypothetical protein TPHA_0A02900 [Tetrapisispora phaffii CBS 4417]|uniref:Oleate activated transcription factor 3 n=1 Tax=Tetrapisispora phaffii (strain ATCC 24235 / CBS 4417 / NBRC 1672 / NRRL Y-8282 / UCD 70-5) TaxID=1071381 RepID=G8BN92_TETPH|nr:hypothetical protein TPHA_0A02900 [Tetrapisispora phaffii CBS 4417]CCE61370.1 hypothetical protein TPHA_0A02900 [Tetrapisispora phaffii CBS 4417]